MASRPVDRDGRLRERGIGERADRDRDRVRQPVLARPEDRRPAVRAEAERPLLTLVGDADVLGVPAHDLDAILRPPRLHSERAAGPTLAGEAVTHRDPQRVALRRHPELAAATFGLALAHASIVPSRVRTFSPGPVFRNDA